MGLTLIKIRYKKINCVHYNKYFNTFLFITINIHFNKNVLNVVKLQLV